MSQRPFRWGLLSTARINRAIIPPLRASARHALVAVASRDPARGAAYAREWEIPRVYDSYDGAACRRARAMTTSLGIVEMNA